MITGDLPEMHYLSGMYPFHILPHLDKFRTKDLESPSKIVAASRVIHGRKRDLHGKDRRWQSPN